MMFLWLRDLVREIGKQMTPCLKQTNIKEQKEKICLIIGVVESKDHKHLNWVLRRVKSLPSTQEGKNIQGGVPVHAKHRDKKENLVCSSNFKLLDWIWRAKCWWESHRQGPAHKETHVRLSGSDFMQRMMGNTDKFKQRNNKIQCLFYNVTLMELVGYIQEDWL